MYVTTQSLDNRYSCDTGSAIARIDTDFERTGQGDIFFQVILVRCQNFIGLDGASTAFKVLILYEFQNLLYLLTKHRFKTAANFKPIVFRGIVAGCYHDVTLFVQMTDGEIANGCRADTDIHDTASGGHQALDQFLGILIRSDAAVPSHRDVGLALPPKIGADALADEHHI